MQLTRTLGSVAAVTALAAAIMLTTAHPARSTDLQDSQTLVNHPAADITDVYAFPSPTNSSNVVLVMNTNPLIPSGQGPGTAFDPTVLYQFQVGHGSAVADTVIQFVANVGNTGQSLTMYGPSAPNANATGSVATIVPTTASSTIPYNKATTLTVKDAAGNSGTVQVFAGPRSDPDFFDLSRFYSIFPDRNFQNHQTTAQVPAPSPSPISFRFPTATANSCDVATAVDFFSSGKYNVLSIVIEMPKTMLSNGPTSTTTSSSVNLWATTSTVTGV